MNSLFVVISAVLAVAVLFGLGLLKTLLHIWRRHRQKLRVLEQYEADPGAFASSREVIERIADADHSGRETLRQDYVITGTALAVIGIACVFLGRAMGYGQVAVGLHLGGIICIGAGVLVALVGYLVRALTRPLLSPEDESA